MVYLAQEIPFYNLFPNYENLHVHFWDSLGFFLMFTCVYMCLHVILWDSLGLKSGYPLNPLPYMKVCM